MWQLTSDDGQTQWAIISDVVVCTRGHTRIITFYQDHLSVCDPHTHFQNHNISMIYCFTGDSQASHGSRLLDNSLLCSGVQYTLLQQHQQGRHYILVNSKMQCFLFRHVLHCTVIHTYCAIIGMTALTGILHIVTSRPTFIIMQLKAVKDVCACKCKAFMHVRISKVLQNIGFSCSTLVFTSFSISLGDILQAFLDPTHTRTLKDFGGRAPPELVVRAYSTPQPPR